MAISFAPGATPAAGAPADPVPMPSPSPATMPATCVPWLHRAPEVALVQAASESMSALSSSVAPLGHNEVWFGPSGLDEQYWATIRPARNGWSTSMPVSRIATVVPAPVYPALWAASARITARLLSRATFCGTSTCTDRTWGERRRRGRSATGTVATRCGVRLMVRVTVPTEPTEPVTAAALESPS